MWNWLLSMNFCMNKVTSIMKRTFIILLTLLLVGPLCAQQQRGRPHRELPKIEEMVNDLSNAQKKKLNAIQKDAKERISKLQAERDDVRDSICALMRMDGDQSEKLFPLLDRENALRSQIIKEKYKTRLKIDKVLTKEQQIVVRKKIEADRKARHERRQGQQHT